VPLIRVRLMVGGPGATPASGTVSGTGPGARGPGATGRSALAGGIVPGIDSELVGSGMSASPEAGAGSGSSCDRPVRDLRSPGVLTIAEVSDTGNRSADRVADRHPLGSSPTSASRPSRHCVAQERLNHESNTARMALADGVTSSHGTNS